MNLFPLIPRWLDADKIPLLPFSRALMDAGCITLESQLFGFFET